MLHKNYISTNKQKGSFLVELMVGLLMSVITILAATTIYAQFEGQKRTTTDVGKALTNAALSLFPLQQSGKMAGQGFNNNTGLGCTVRAHNESTGSDYTFTLSPALITLGGNETTPDSITFLFGDSEDYYAPGRLTQATALATSPYKIDSRYGFRVGDIIIASEPGKDCSMRQISELPAIIGETDAIKHESATNFLDPYTNTNKATKYNKSGGSGVTYGTNSKIFNLGNQPQLLTFSIVNNQLQQNNRISGADDITIIGDNIVNLKAMYGFDTNNDNNVDSWTTVTPPVGDPAAFSQMIAIRVALLARSPLREKAENGVCNITNSSTIAYANGNFDVSNIADWGCYRYRVLQTTIPLKNMIWRNSL